LSNDRKYLKAKKEKSPQLAQRRHKNKSDRQGFHLTYYFSYF